MLTKKSKPLSMIYLAVFILTISLVSLVVLSEISKAKDEMDHIEELGRQVITKPPSGDRN